MFDRRVQLLAVLLIAISSAHCSSRDHYVRAGQGPVVETVHESFTEDALLMLRFDSTGDGTPDTIKYFEVLDEEGEVMTSVEGLFLRDLLEQELGLVHSSRTRLLRTEIDLTGNGEPDLIRHYNARAQLIREQSIPLGDGLFANTTHFNQGIPARTEVDTNGDGTLNKVRHFRNGLLHFIEEDTNGDGVFDIWRFYRGSMLVRVGRDLTGNGEVDRWEVLQRTGALRIRDGEGREQESEGDEFVDEDDLRHDASDAETDANDEAPEEAPVETEDADEV